MTSAELQQRFQKKYVTADWLDTLRQILPSTEIFATPQPIALDSARAESILQLGKIPLAGDRNLAVLEVIVDEETDLPSNRAALRHLVARYIDQAEYHGVFAIFHQRKAKDYRFTFAAREAAFDDSGQLVRTETAPRRYTYLLGPNESCRTAAERFDLLARKGIAATIADVRAAFDKEPLTREFFKRFETAIEAVKTDLEKNQALPSAQAYSRAQLLLERLLFLYFVQNRGWLDQKRNYLLDNFHSHRAIPNECTYYADFLERVFFTLSTPPDFKGPGAGIRLAGLPFLNGGLFDDDEFAQTQERKKDNPPLRVRNGTLADVFENLLEAFNFTAHEDTPIDQDVAVDPEMLGKVFESIVLHAEAADPDAVAPDKRKATGSYYTPRIVVHFICRESLCQYLLPRLTEGTDWNRRLRAILAILALDGLDADELALLKPLLTPAEGQQILDLIRDLKCLDPSVGSGAFPVGLLHELVNLRRICDAAALGYVGLYVLGLGAISYGCYALDKRRARAQEWRISEAGLHLTELLGGWPGAFLAQRRLRHKVSKSGYQFVFWLIVLGYQFAAYDSLQNWRLSRAAWDYIEHPENRTKAAPRVPVIIIVTNAAPASRAIK